MNNQDERPEPPNSNNKTFCPIKTMKNITSLAIPCDTLRQITGKAYCFQFENGERAIIPRSEVSSLTKIKISGICHYHFSIPKWLVNAVELDFNGITEYIVDTESTTNHTEQYEQESNITQRTTRINKSEEYIN